MSGLRDKLKDAEFYLPAPACRIALRTTRLVDNPYTEGMDALGCIFIHVPKTAGTSIADVLFGAKSRHIPAVRYRAWDQAKFDRYYKFCVVRNPFDRLYSAYSYLRASAGDRKFRDHAWATDNLSRFDSFEAFVLALAEPPVRRSIMAYIHFRPQHHWVRLPLGTPCAMDKVGRYEALDDDYREIMGRLGRPAPELSHRRMGKRGHYREVYTARMKDIAADLYRNDLKLFGYGFD